MATTKPRITVTLDQDQYELLSEFAKLQGCSMSASFATIWGEAAPTIRKIVDLIKEAEQARDSIGDRIRDLAFDTEGAMLAHARSAIEQLDVFEKQVQSAIQKAKDSSAGRSEAP